MINKQLCFIIGTPFNTVNFAYMTIEPITKKWRKEFDPIKAFQTIVERKYLNSDLDLDLCTVHEIDDYSLIAIVGNWNEGGHIRWDNLEESPYFPPDRLSRVTFIPPNWRILENWSMNDE